MNDSIHSSHSSQSSLDSTSSFIPNYHTEEKISIKYVLSRIALVVLVMIIMTGGGLLSAVIAYSAPAVLLAIALPCIFLGVIFILLWLRYCSLLPSHIQVTTIDTKKQKPEKTTPILDQAQQIEYIQKNIHYILAHGYLPHIKYHYNASDKICFSFRKDSQKVYKLGKNVVDITHKDAPTHIKNLAKSYTKIKSICTSKNLDHLIVPDIQHVTIASHSYNSKNFVHDVLIEPKLNFYNYNNDKANHLLQKQLHLKHFEQIRPAIDQLTHLIFQTGCLINYNTCLLDPDSIQKLNLYDVMIPKSCNEEITMQHIEDSLFGTPTTPGLINCLYSKLLIESVLNIAATYGMDINSPKIQALVQSRLDQLDNQQLIRDLYQNPPKLLDEADISHLSFKELERKSVDISEEAMQYAKDMLLKIMDPSIPKSQKTGITFNPENNSLIFSDHPDWTFIMYRAHDKKTQSANRLTENVFKKILFLKQTIKISNLDTLMIPETELLQVEMSGRFYNIIASRKLPIPKDYQLYCNDIIASSGTHYLKAFKQLAYLNTVSGLNISNENTILLEQHTKDHYHIGLTVFDYYCDRDDDSILYLTSYSEKTLDAVLSEAARSGVLYIDPETENIDNYKYSVIESSHYNPYLSTIEFYRQRNLSSVDELLNVTVNDLAPYLNLDDRATFYQIIDGKETNAVTVSMRVAIPEVVNELNRLLQQRLDSTLPNAPLTYRRSLTVNLITEKESPLLYNYLNSTPNISPDPTRTESILPSYYVSWVDQILLALKAKGLVHIPTLLNEGSKVLRINV